MFYQGPSLYQKEQYSIKWNYCYIVLVLLHNLKRENAQVKILIFEEDPTKVGCEFTATSFEETPGKCSRENRYFGQENSCHFSTNQVQSETHHQYVTLSRVQSFETLYGGQFTLSTQLIKAKLSFYTPPPMQHHSFYRNLPASIYFPDLH